MILGPENSRRFLKTNLNLSWKDVAENSDLIPSGHQIGEAEILFAQIEDTEIQKQIDKLEATKKANVEEIASSLAKTEG